MQLDRDGERSDVILVLSVEISEQSESRVAGYSVGGEGLSLILRLD